MKKFSFTNGEIEWMNDEWMMHLYSALLYLHTKRFTIMCVCVSVCVWGGSPQPPPVCSIHLDDATAATGQRRQCAHHTPATDGERVIEAIQWMEIIKRQGPVGGIWPGHRGYTPTLYEKCHGIFNDHRVSGPRFNVSSERRCSLTVKCAHHYPGALGPTQTTGWAPPAGLTNTSTNSNLVFIGGLPSRYWPGSTLLSFCGQPVLGCRVIWLWLW